MEPPGPRNSPLYPCLCDPEIRLVSCLSTVFGVACEYSRFSFSLLRARGGGDSHMKQTGMLVGNFEFNP